MTVIDSDAARCQEMSEKFPGVLVIHGDGADAELLSEERITDMDAFVALTGLDETNIILAMYASQINSCKVVAKINRESFAELAAAKGMVDSVVSTASVTSESIAMYVRAMQNSFESENIKTLHRLVGGRVEALEFNVAPGLPFIGVPLKDRPAQGAAGGGHRAPQWPDSHPVRQRCPAGGRRCRHRHHRHNAAPLRDIVK